MNAHIPFHALYRHRVEYDGIQLESLCQLRQASQLEVVIRGPVEWHRFIWLKAGTAQAIICDKNVEVDLPALISIPPGCPFTLDAQGTGFSLSLSPSYIEKIIWQLEGMADPIQHCDHVISSQLLARRADRLSIIFDQIATEYDGDHIYRRPALYGNATLLIVEVARLLSLQPQNHGAVTPIKGQAIFRRFKALVDAHFNEHWKIPQYAMALATNERALRRICKAVAGVTPIEVVHQRIVDEAKRKLLFSEKTVSEICYDLGFCDPSHFTKYFANNQGLSPSAYRAQRRGHDLFC